LQTWKSVGSRQSSVGSRQSSIMRDLSVGKESRLIFQFALPMLVGNVFQQLYNVVDSIVVGKFIGKEALAAVGASFPIIFTLMSMLIGVAIGSTIIIAQYFGAKDMQNVKKAINTLYIFLFFASVFITVVGILFSRQIFQLMNVPAEVIPLAVRYFNVYMLGSVFYFGFNGISAVLRGLGDSKTPLYFMIITTLLNVALALLFVISFGWGVTGAALATVIAQFVTLVMAIVYLNRKHEVVKLNFRKLGFDMDIFKKGIRIGFPIGFQQAFVALSMMAMYWLVNRFGTNAAAAYSVAFRIDSFASMPAMNFANALSTFVGQNLGAGKPERVKRGFVSTFYMTSAVSICITILAMAFSDPIMRLFTNDAEVIAIGKSYLLIVTGFYVIFSTMFIVGGVMRGAGDTFIPMLITFIALWVVRIPVCYYLSEHTGFTGIWWGIPIAWVIGLVLHYSYYATGRWKKKALVRGAYSS
jgi:putative MATE family efflux protein